MLRNTLVWGWIWVQSFKSWRTPEVKKPEGISIQGQHGINLGRSKIQVTFHRSGHSHHATDRIIPSPNLFTKWSFRSRRNCVAWVIYRWSSYVYSWSVESELYLTYFRHDTTHLKRLTVTSITLVQYFAGSVTDRQLHNSCTWCIVLYKP